MTQEQAIVFLVQFLQLDVEVAVVSIAIVLVLMHAASGPPQHQICVVGIHNGVGSTHANLCAATMISLVLWHLMSQA